MSVWDTLGDVADFIIPAGINPFGLSSDAGQAEVEAQVADFNRGFGNGGDGSLQIHPDANAGGEFTQAQGGYTGISGGINNYGVARPDYLTSRNDQGDLSERFKQNMGGSWQSLSDRANTVGDTGAAKLQRQMANNQYVNNMSNMSQQQARELSQARSNMGMRGGVDSGNRAMLAKAGMNQSMAGAQGLGRSLANQNLGISVQDDASKTALKQQVGNVEQKINEANINRLSSDLSNQNSFAANTYGEGMKSYGAIKSAEAARPDEGKF